MIFSSDDYYADEIEKAKYYYERIMKQLIKRGSFPREAEVEKIMSDLSLRLPLFQFKNYKTNELFDTEKFNSDFLLIYNDLLILYKLAYRFAIKDYEQVRTYIETHLTELENLADRYERMSRLETGSTSIGQTLVAVTNGYDATINNTTINIKLGQIQAYAGSKLICIFDSNEVMPDQVMFYIGGTPCAPYSYYHDYFRVPGNIARNVYTASMPSTLEAQPLTPILIDAKDFEATLANKYIVYGGENMVSVKTSEGTEYLDASSGNVTLSGDGKISFYLIEGTYLEFNFSKKPKSQNFDGTYLDKPSQAQLIEMEFEDGFTFAYQTNGKLFAEKKSGLVANKKLYYPVATPFTSFLVHEYLQREIVTYDTSVVIKEIMSGKVPAISLISIKEIKETEVEEE